MGESSDTGHVAVACAHAKLVGLGFLCTTFVVHDVGVDLLVPSKKFQFVNRVQVRKMAPNKWGNGLYVSTLKGGKPFSTDIIDIFLACYPEEDLYYPIPAYLLGDGHSLTFYPPHRPLTRGRYKGTLRTSGFLNRFEIFDLDWRPFNQDAVSGLVTQRVS